MLMNYLDITDISFVYEDGTEEYYIVYFSGDYYKDYLYTNYDAQLNELSITIDKDYDSVE